MHPTTQFARTKHVGQTCQTQGPQSVARNVPAVNPPSTWQRRATDNSKVSPATCLVQSAAPNIVNSATSCTLVRTSLHFPPCPTPTDPYPTHTHASAQSPQCFIL